MDIGTIKQTLVASINKKLNYILNKRKCIPSSMAISPLPSSAVLLLWDSDKEIWGMGFVNGGRSPKEDMELDTPISFFIPVLKMNANI